jgi:aryl-phospho-beta-D-glucosidase BglC (GH1 family)
VAGAEFGAPVVDRTSAFSNANRGTPERDYHFDSAATFEYLAGRGVRLVRIPFRWERLQPKLDRALDAGELGRLRGLIGRARAAGLSVILDMHNYGGYFLFDGSQGVRRPVGSRLVPIAAFADVWRRISRAFDDEPGVVGYGLMNEPVELDPVGGLSPQQVWFRASQAAVSAIRRAGDRTLILVAGYQWSGVQQWTRWQPRPWIRDPAENVRYEAHHYWDCDHSGTYARTHEEEVAAAESGQCGS